MQKYIAIGIEADGREYNYDVEAPSKTEAKKALQANGITVIAVASARSNHVCKYCGNISRGVDEDLLCDECRELFGHAFYHEL